MQCLNTLIGSLIDIPSLREFLHLPPQFLLNEISSTLLAESINNATKSLPKNGGIPLMKEHSYGVVKWEGSTIDDFVFTDSIAQKARRIFKDCSSSHGFKIRGPNYCSDKKKVRLILQFLNKQRRRLCLLF